MVNVGLESGNYDTSPIWKTRWRRWMDLISGCARGHGCTGEAGACGGGCAVDYYHYYYSRAKLRSIVGS